MQVVALGRNGPHHLCFLSLSVYINLLQETTNGHVLMAKVGQKIIMESGCGPHIMPVEGLAPSGKLFLSNTIWTFQ